MTTKMQEKLENAWRTLEAGQAQASTRTLDDLGIDDPRLLLGIEEGCRELVIESLAKPEGRASSTRAVKVVARTVGERSKARHYLVIRCTSPDLYGVFRRFTASVLERVGGTADPANEAITVLREWQRMFERAGRSKETTVVGLFGELSELLGLARTNPRAVLAWMGPLGEPQDFVNGRLALELKTSSVRTSEVEIHGLEQLWAAPYEKLVLGVTRIVEDAAGRTLEDLVEELGRIGVSRADLDERLEALGWDAQRLGESRTRFTSRGTRYFLVSPQAPALTPDHLRGPLPAGVDRLRYVVALDAPGFVEMTGDSNRTFLASLATVPST